MSQCYGPSSGPGSRKVVFLYADHYRVGWPPATQKVVADSAVWFRLTTVASFAMVFPTDSSIIWFLGRPKDAPTRVCLG